MELSINMGNSNLCRKAFNYAAPVVGIICIYLRICKYSADATELVELKQTCAMKRSFNHTKSSMFLSIFAEVGMIVTFLDSLFLVWIIIEYMAEL